MHPCMFYYFWVSAYLATRGHLELIVSPVWNGLWRGIRVKWQQVVGEMLYESRVEAA